jgi:hypothetical protein
MENSQKLQPKWLSLAPDDNGNPQYFSNEISKPIKTDYIKKYVVDLGTVESQYFR